MKRCRLVPDRFSSQTEACKHFALLLTLVLLFAFQGGNIINNPLTIVLIAVPLLIQTYFIFFITWYSGRS